MSSDPDVASASASEMTRKYPMSDCTSSAEAPTLSPGDMLSPAAVVKTSDGAGSHEPVAVGSEDVSEPPSPQQQEQPSQQDRGTLEAGTDSGPEASSGQRQADSNDDTRQPESHLSCKYTREEIMARHCGVTVEQMGRVKALLRMGVSEEDLLVAERLLKMGSDLNSDTPWTKEEQLLGYSASQRQRIKALHTLGLTENTFEKCRTVFLSSLGPSAFGFGLDETAATVARAALAGDSWTPGEELGRLRRRRQYDSDAGASGEGAHNFLSGMLSGSNYSGAYHAWKKHDRFGHFGASVRDLGVSVRDFGASKKDLGIIERTGCKDGGGNMLVQERFVRSSLVSGETAAAGGLVQGSGATGAPPDAHAEKSMDHAAKENKLILPSIHDSRNGPVEDRREGRGRSAASDGIRPVGEGRGMVRGADGSSGMPRAAILGTRAVDPT